MKYLNSRNRAILREMVSTDFKVRYQGSALGYLWSLLKPLFIFAILYVVFVYIIPLGKEIQHYPVYLLLGIVLWNFFSETTILGASSVVARGDLIRKISIPRYLLVIASSLSALINLGLSMIVVFIFALLNGVAPSLMWLLVIPVIIELYILAIGIAFFLSAVYVRFRDVTYIWEIVLQAGFYASAIIFPITMVPEHLRQWFFLNPIVQMIQDARYVVATDTTLTIWNVANPWLIAVPFAIVAICALGGYMYFKKKSKYFAEDI